MKLLGTRKMIFSSFSWAEEETNFLHVTDGWEVINLTNRNRCQQNLPSCSFLAFVKPQGLSPVTVEKQTA